MTYIHKEDWPEVDKLVDWLIEKNRSGYKMVNSVQRLNEMREFMRGKLQEWNCRAGHNNVIIRVDGTLAPCFPMYSATFDWGVVGKHNFERKQLEEMKTGCQPHCFSTDVYKRQEQVLFSVSEISFSSALSSLAILPRRPG